MATSKTAAAVSHTDMLIESAKVSKIGIDDVVNALELIYTTYELNKTPQTTGEELRWMQGRGTIGSMISILILRLMEISEDLENQLNRIGGAEE